MERKSKSGFIPPNEEQRTLALGDLSKECPANIKAVLNIPKYWEPCKAPQPGDWLDYYNHSCYKYNEFAGKIVTARRNVLYI